MQALRPLDSLNKKPTFPLPKIMILPNELLSLVFTLYCAYPFNHVNLGNMIRASNTPVALMQVCRHWYHVAVTTPNLWTLLILTPRRLIPTTMLEERLRRSKMASLSIFARKDATAVVEELRRLSDLQVESSGDLYGRIQSLYLDLGDSDIKSIVDLMKFPRLERFDIINAGSSQNLSLDIPSLRSMTLRWPGWSSWPLCQFYKLEALRIYDPIHNAVFGLVAHGLQQIPNLQSLVVVQRGRAITSSSYPLTTKPTKMVSLYRLQYLDVGGLPIHVLKTLLKYIDAPGLTELVIRPYYYTENGDWSDLKAKFLNARKIRILDAQKPYKILKGILHCTPDIDEYSHLQYLDISNDPYYGIPGDDWTWPAAAMPLPRLCTVRVDNVSLESVRKLLEAYPSIHTAELNFTSSNFGDSESDDNFASFQASLAWIRQRVNQLSVGRLGTPSNHRVARYTQALLEPPEKQLL